MSQCRTKGNFFHFGDEIGSYQYDISCSNLDFCIFYFFLASTHLAANRLTVCKLTTIKLNLG